MGAGAGAGAADAAAPNVKLGVAGGADVVEGAGTDAPNVNSDPVVAAAAGAASFLSTSPTTVLVGGGVTATAGAGVLPKVNGNAAGLVSVGAAADAPVSGAIVDAAPATPAVAFSPGVAAGAAAPKVNVTGGGGLDAGGGASLGVVPFCISDNAAPSKLSELFWLLPPLPLPKDDTRFGGGALVLTS